MPSTTHTSSPTKGMIHDLHLVNIGESGYSFAYNAVIEDFWKGNYGVISNEPSNKCSVEFPADYQVVGFINITEQNRTVYFLHNPKTGTSQIGEVINCTHFYPTDKEQHSSCDSCGEVYNEEITPLEKQKEQCYCTYKMILSSSCLDFNIHYPVDIEYKLTNISLQLYFTDNINERRFIYFDYIDNDPTKYLVLQDRFKVQIGTEEAPCETPIYSNDLDCEKIKIHPNYNRVCPEFIDFVNGGNLKAGTYQILVAYSDIYGNPMSSYFPSSLPIPLFEKDITLDTTYVTTKSLFFRVNNLKSSGLYQYYNIVIAQTIDNFTEFNLVATLPTTQTEYIYTGNETSIRRLDPTEVLFKRPYYKLAKGVTKANDYLFFNGVKEYPVLNLQPVANQIRLFWKTIAIKEKAYRNPRNAHLYRTYQRDEVYSFGIIFEFSNGRETCVFHIPGRPATSNDLLNVTEVYDIIDTSNCSDVSSCTRQEGVTKVWETYNTATIEGDPHEYTENCEDSTTWEYGNFSYWESTERYPNIPEIWGDLCGQCIRHHKFPDSNITHIHDGLGETRAYNENNYIYPLGIMVDHDSVMNALDLAVTNNIITQEDRDSIKSYRIVRGNRIGNKSVVAKGLLFNMLEYTRDNRTYYAPNYPYNDLRINSHSDPFLQRYTPIDTFGIENTNTMYTFHSPDVHFVNSGIGNILKIEAEEYGKSEGYFTYSDCQAKYSFLSSFSYILALGLGIAAALSATGEKECKTVVRGHKEKTSQLTWSVASGTGGTLGTFLTDSNDTNTESYSSYDPVTGLTIPTPPLSNKEEHITTCTGQSFQIFTTNVWINVLIGGANQIIQRTILGIFEMNKILDLIRSLLPDTNLSAQYNSVGKYNNYNTISNGQRVRNIIKSSYLTPNLLTVDAESPDPSVVIDSYNINNWGRESSVFLKLNNGLINPSVIDDSKTTMHDQFPLPPLASRSFKDVIDIRFNKNISSYYVSVKNNMWNQYGKICDIEYLELGNCSIKLEEDVSEKEITYFGGDTYINRFALKRKLPLFKHTMCKMPNNSDVLYDELSNVARPIYYFNTPEPLLARLEGTSGLGVLDYLSLITELTSENSKNYDVQEPKIFYQKGLIPLFVYGIPYFLVESDINVDYRHGENVTDKNFYPNITDLKTWFEEENVPILTDNYYFYNKTYSKQNKESSICTSCILDIKDLIRDSINYNRIIYSDISTNEHKSDNWLIFKANNYYDFDLTKGKLISADGIEDSKILVRLEKGTQIFNAFDTLQASSTNIQVGTGGIFSSRPQDIAITDLGYAGTQHKSIIHTEFGHIWADAERGQVFLLNTGGRGIDEISKNGMKSFFKENLPFTIKKHFLSVDIDNNFNNIGLHFGYDKRFNRLLLTKLDYIPKSDDIKYNSSEKYFYILNQGVETIVNVENPKYFCNKSWTISYNFYNQSWTSFHSYTPFYYVNHISTFESSVRRLINDNGTLRNVQKNYTHNTTNKSYQVFYGKLQPFIVETISKPDLTNNTLHAVEFMLDVARYHNEYDYYFNTTKTFNKAIIYNETQCTGLLNLKVSDVNDMSESFRYPERTSDGLNILVSNSENMWRFNDFYNIVPNKYNNLPVMVYDCNNVIKRINKKAINYEIKDIDKELMRGRMHRTMYIQDIYSNYKYSFYIQQLNQRKSIR